MKVKELYDKADKLSKTTKMKGDAYYTGFHDAWKEIRQDLRSVRDNAKKGERQLVILRKVREPAGWEKALAWCLSGLAYVALLVFVAQKYYEGYELEGVEKR